MSRGQEHEVDLNICRNSLNIYLRFDYRPLWSHHAIFRVRILSRRKKKKENRDWSRSQYVVTRARGLNASHEGEGANPTRRRLTVWSNGGRHGKGEVKIGMRSIIIIDRHTPSFFFFFWSRFYASALSWYARSCLERVNGWREGVMNPFVSLHAVDAMCFDAISRCVPLGLFISIRLSFVEFLKNIFSRITRIHPSSFI